MRNAISGLILLACTCFVAFACLLMLSVVAYASDCGGCKADDCHSCKPEANAKKCGPCKPQVERDPCRTVKPKCISTDNIKVPGRTEIPLPKTGCRKEPDCCPQAEFKLLNLCPVRYTLCTEGSDYTLLCEEECKPCKPVKCNKCEFSWCNDGCKAPKCDNKCSTPKCKGGDDCNKCGKSPSCVKCKP